MPTKTGATKPKLRPARRLFSRNGITRRWFVIESKFAKKWMLLGDGEVSPA